MEYPIRQDDGTVLLQEPLLGAWYCEFSTQRDAETGEERDVDGALAQYVGKGEFYDEGEDTPMRMDRYDYLVFQHQGTL